MPVLDAEGEYERTLVVKMIIMRLNDALDLKNKLQANIKGKMLRTPPSCCSLPREEQVENGTIYSSIV